MTSNHKANRKLFIGICHECDKRLYDSRKKARHVAKMMHGEKMQTYPCDHVQGMWHIGHKDHGVTRGLVTRAERYPRAA